MFPHEYQLDAKDCGPASIKIIAKYYGRFYSLQFLRDLCGITREGVSFLDISHACEKIGLRTLNTKITWEELQRAPLPCIIHWNEDHFVVLYKIKKRKKFIGQSSNEPNHTVYISDPAKGLLKYSQQDFKKGWLGNRDRWAVMLMEPMADFKQRDVVEKKERLKTVENVLGYFTPYKKAFRTLLFVMLIVTLLQSLLPFISKSVIDVGIQTNDVNFIYLVLIANIVIILSTLLCNVVRDWILLHLTSRVNIAIISDYLIKLMRLPITFFENKLVGDIIQRANDHERIRAFVMNNSLSFLFSTLTFFVFIGVLFSYNQLLAVIYIVGNALYIGWIFLFFSIRRKLDWEYFELVSKNQSFWVETIGGILDIKVNNYENKKRWRWEGIQVRMHKLNQKVLAINSMQTLGGQFFNQLTNLSITFFCAVQVLKGQATFGVMIATQFIIGILGGPIAQFISFIQSFQYAKISFFRLNEVHQLEEEEERVTGSVLFPDSKSLFLKNVSFQYSVNTAPVLRNISLIIPQHQVTAIVGDSGSGKSTLLKVIMRLYKPTYGNIYIGNTNLENISLRDWRNNCGVVLQDGKIFNDTILNNIVLEDDNIDYSRLRKAVRVANIEGEIDAMPLGYQTMMGEEGRGLSGGQKQRVLIARALYKDPDYLFFDEATNSLDAINEQKIVDALDAVFNNKTVIVIAHRLSTIVKAQQIIVIHKGSVVEIGNHDILMKKENGHYAALVKAQMGGMLYAS
ncbi:peptidase domain-containing ABC transporter [Danxiaibacter flavus]|uniref:Peptidase domain-containing ABC transporter n=1 Tax=Danxiaibacter flavus TaxID=3049108 RepID=A0ABV3Z9Z2_9BACT|nr:peptidase domain-containing ABC transporter [Chitinophagaceae bacterium DXS]